MKGFDVLVTIDGKPVAAQLNADLRRAATTSDISNLIALDWADSLVHLKSWSVQCTGAYIVDDEALMALEDAFAKGADVELKIESPSLKYKGKAVITNFPIGATYNKDMTYNLTFIGKGPLERIIERDPELIGYCLDV